MPSFQLFLLFLAADAALKFTPGPDMALPRSGGMTQGFTTNLLNPKVLLFTIAFLPQFTTPDNGPVWLQMLVLGITMKVLSLPYGSCFAYGASRIRGWVGRNPWFLRMRQGLLGAVMVGLALYALYSTAETLAPRSVRIARPHHAFQ